MPSPEVDTATMVASGSRTPVVRKPAMTIGKAASEVAPSSGGKMRFPAPKKSAKSISPVVTIAVAGLVGAGEV